MVGNTTVVVLLFFVLTIFLLTIQKNRKVESNSPRYQYEWQLQREIRSLLSNHSSSIQLLRKMYAQSGTLQHELLKSINEKVKKQVALHPKLKHAPEHIVEHYIEEELKKRIHTQNEFFKRRPHSYQPSSRRRSYAGYVKVLLTTCLCLIVLMIMRYIYSTPIDQMVALSTFQSSFLNKDDHEQDVIINEDLTFKIISLNSGVLEGWINKNDQFYDQLSLLIEVQNTSGEPINLTPEMFTLSDSEGYTPSILEEQTSFQSIPIPPNESIKVKLHYAVSLKKTTGEFILTVSEWDSYERFIIRY